VNYRKTIAACVVAAAAVATAITPGAASAAPDEGRSILEVLQADGNRLDKNWGDFDITHKFMTDAIAEGPGLIFKGSPRSAREINEAFAALADGSYELTAFLPTDRAWRRVLVDMEPEGPVAKKQVDPTEKAVYAELRGVVGGTSPIWQFILLNQIVPEQKLNYRQLRQSDGDQLETAIGGYLEVDKGSRGRVFLRDEAPFKDMVVKRNTTDINKGNPQIAHAVKRISVPFFLS
jgi:hypothetical protein